VKALNKIVHRIIIDEGASTCIISMSCWKTLGSPTLSRSSTTLNPFDRQKYTPYGILSNLQVELEENTVETDVEVIDGNLDYNILLGRPWIYAIATFVSTYLRKIAFPFQGGITCNMISSIQKISENGISMDHLQVLPPSPIEIL